MPDTPDTEQRIAETLRSVEAHLRAHLAIWPDGQLVVWSWPPTQTVVAGHGRIDVEGLITVSVRP